MFYACFTLIGSLEGRKHFRVGIFLNKNLLWSRVTGNKQLLLLGHIYYHLWLEKSLKMLEEKLAPSRGEGGGATCSVAVCEAVKSITPSDVKLLISVMLITLINVQRNRDLS